MIRSSKRRVRCDSLKLQDVFRERINEKSFFSHNEMWGDKEMPDSEFAGREVISYDLNKDEYNLFYTTSWINEAFVGPKKLYIVTLRFIDNETLEYSLSLKLGFKVAYMIIYLVLVLILYLNLINWSPFLVIPIMVFILFFRSNRKTKRNYEKEVESYLIQLSK